MTAASATSCAGRCAAWSGRGSARSTCCAAARRSPRRRSSASGCSTTCRDEHGPFDVDRRRPRLPRRAGDAADELGYALRRDEQGRPVDAAPPGGPHGRVRRRPGRPRPGHPGRAAPGDGHGRGRPRALRARATTRTSCVRALRRPQRAGHATAWPRRSPSSARRPTEFRARGRASSADGLVSHLRARRRPAGRRARRPEGGATTAAPPDGCAASRCTATPPARPTSSACRCATRGPTTTAAGRWCSTATRPTPEPEWVNNTMCLDTGCVFGGHAHRAALPREGARRGAGRAGLVRAGQAVPATATEHGGPTASRREPDQLDINDVLGKRGRRDRATTAGSRSARRTPPARSR